MLSLLKTPGYLAPTKKCFQLLILKANESHYVNRNTLLPTQAQVIICGAGAVANSVAYHLIENGWTDVLILDKGRCEYQSYKHT